MISGKIEYHEEPKKTTYSSYTYGEDNKTFKELYDELETEIVLAKNLGFTVGKTVVRSQYETDPNAVLGTIVEYAKCVRDGFDSLGNCTPIKVAWSNKTSFFFSSSELTLRNTENAS